MDEIWEKEKNVRKKAGNLRTKPAKVRNQSKVSWNLP